MNRSARDYELGAEKNCVRRGSCGKEMTVVIAWIREVFTQNEPLLQKVSNTHVCAEAGAA